MNATVRKNLNPETMPQLLDRLLNFYFDETLYTASDEQERQAAVNFYKRMNEQEINLFNHVPLTLDSGKFFSMASNDEAYQLFIGFKNFCKLLYQVLNAVDIPQYAAPIPPLTRKKLPELTAFDITGNNDLNVFTQKLADNAVSY